MKKRIAGLLISLLIILGASGCTSQEKASLADQTDFKYTLYIGLNDQDTYEQLISEDEAQNLISDICLKYVDSYTSSQRQGAYKNEKGVATRENSLVFEFYAATEEQIKSIMDEVLVKLNQNSILVEKAKVSYKSYKGVKKR